MELVSVVLLHIFSEIMHRSVAELIIAMSALLLFVKLFPFTIMFQLASNTMPKAPDDATVLSVIASS
ncbi:hypothetical protein D3C72_2547120 [compost metagenome]